MPSGTPGNSRQEPAGVGNDDGLRHAEAPDPPRSRFCQRRLNDRRPDEGDGDLAFPLLHEGSLAQGLRKGVGIGPPQRERTGGACRDELTADPFLPELLRFRRDEVIAGGTDFSPGLLGEAAELLWLARLCLEVVAQASGRGDFGFPRDVKAEAVLAEKLLLGFALVCAGDVCGGDGHQVCRRTCLGDGSRDPRWPEKVDLDGLGQRGVEGDGGGGVNDDVSGSEGATALVVEPEAVAAHVAGHRVDPSAPPPHRSHPRVRRATGRSSRSLSPRGRAGRRHQLGVRGGPTR